mmetsp:Transcript_3928/g.9600  ORF Transcript_3928/g.9600 Transcript_3928/m.9600 type:complete len:95 (+) Transcript_3928:1508-1792(+)
MCPAKRLRQPALSASLPVCLPNTGAMWLVPIEAFCLVEELLKRSYAKRMQFRQRKSNNIQHLLFFHRLRALSLSLSLVAAHSPVWQQNRQQADS